MSKIEQEHNAERARLLLAVFSSLSPLRVEQVQEELLALAPELGPAFFPEAVRFAESLIARYLKSPVKRSEQEVLTEYFHALEMTSKRLLANGNLPKAEENATPRPANVAMVPQDFYTSHQWCVITEETNMPLVLMSAVDAAKRRNYLVDSVLEPLFQFLLLLDREQAFTWQLALCEGRSEAALDPDIARDLLRVWRRQPSLPPEVLQRVILFGEDEKTYRHWPAVIEEADRLLRVQALQAWVKKRGDECRSARQLKQILPSRDDRRLMRWLHTAIEGLGTSIDFFVSQSEQQSDPAAQCEWRRPAMLQELSRLERLMPPILLLSDLLLLAPTGSYDFAMAIFGFTRHYKRSWERALQNCSKDAIRKRFMDDARQGRSPELTIRSLCFENQELERRAINELDSLSRNFDSIHQREVVIEKLCGIYSSFHEERLLNEEISGRYRRMMRVLHEDSLRRVLGDDFLVAFTHLREVLLDLSVIGNQSRRFLAMRRALDRTTAEVIAADMDFTNSMRRLRATYIRRLLDI